MIQDAYLGKPVSENVYTDAAKDPCIGAMELYRKSDGKIIAVQGRERIVGRCSGAHVALTSMYTARIHAKLIFESGKWYLSDAHAMNKTYLNGKALVPFEKYELRAGDSITFADEAYCVVNCCRRPAARLEESVSAQVKEAPSNELIGKVINGKYRIVSKFWHNTTTAAYLSREEHTNQKWMIKVIDQTQRSVKDVKQSLLEVPQLLMELDHPAIPKVACITEDEQYIYIVQEYSEGKPLNKIIWEEGRIPVDTAIAWTIQLCEALQQLHAHNPPYVFCAVHPGNIMLKTDGRLRLIDFGRTEEYKQKETVNCLGPVGYAAPEQFCGIPEPRSDVFALGMLLHSMLTGTNPTEPPYEIKPIREIDPALPRTLEAVVEKCTQRDPDARFQSCESLIAALQPDKLYPSETNRWKRFFGKKR